MLVRCISDVIMQQWRKYCEEMAVYIHIIIVCRFLPFAQTIYVIYQVRTVARLYHVTVSWGEGVKV